MVENKQRNSTLKKLARWSPSSNQHPIGKKSPNVLPLSPDAPFNPIISDGLHQGKLYIIKIKQVSIALFEGWNDDMCCFSVLRADTESLRWSEARHLPNDFDIYEAFDEAGNPPIHLWTKNLRVPVPSNWFNMFEEAKRQQRGWLNRQNQSHGRNSMSQSNSDEYYYSDPITGHHQQFDGQSVGTLTNMTDIMSNTDVSTMNLTSITNSSSHIVPASVVALNDVTDNHSGGGMLASRDELASIANNSVLDNSHVDHLILSSPTRNLHTIMDREQIRKHLAPGQASLTNRSNSSKTMLGSSNYEYSPITLTESPLSLSSNNKNQMPLEINSTFEPNEHIRVTKPEKRSSSLVIGHLNEIGGENTHTLVGI